MRQSAGFLLGLTLVFVLAACGGQQPKPPATTPTPAPAAQTPSEAQPLAQAAVPAVPEPAAAAPVSEPAAAPVSEPAPVVQAEPLPAPVAPEATAVAPPPVAAESAPKRQTLCDAEKTIAAFVTADVYMADDGSCDYRYALANEPASTQGVKQLCVLCPTAPEKVGVPEGWAQEYVADKGCVSWTPSDAANAGVGPGQTLTGFWIRSAGLPAVVACSIQDTPDAPAAPKGNTVGPGLVPTEDTPPTLELLDELAVQVQLCIDQDWIGSEEEGDRLLSTANAAKRMASRKSQIHTVQSVEMFLKFAKVDVKSPNAPMTSEAVGLLTSHAQYLLTRLAAHPLKPPKPTQ